MPVDPFCFGFCDAGCTLLFVGVGAVLCVIGCIAACDLENVPSRYRRFHLRVPAQQTA